MKQLTSLRENAKMTIQELAEATGTTRVSIWRYEHGKRKPDAETAIKIAKALKCTVEDLMTEKGA